MMRRCPIIMACVLMLSWRISAEPREPSPASGGWLELRPDLPIVHSEGHWFPNLSEPVTLEAWVYMDEFPPPLTAFSLIGQEKRFNWVIIGGASDMNLDRFREVHGSLLAKGIEKDAGMVSHNLPLKRWFHYVAVIDKGCAVGLNGLIPSRGSGSALAPADGKLIIGGIPVLKGIELPGTQKAARASGVYIDELRISNVVRYEGRYSVPTGAFRENDKTLGLYHFDDDSGNRFKDSSHWRIPLSRDIRKRP